MNYSNFKVWYDQHKVPGMSLDLDKDILFKGNKVYSPETCCFVPHAINTLFLSKKADRGAYPIGVSYDKSKGKFRAEMSFMGEQIKLGTFDTAESAFARYKEYKEDLLLRLLKIDIFNSHIFQCILAFDAENSRILSLHISVIHA